MDAGADTASFAVPVTITSDHPVKYQTLVSGPWVNEILGRKVNIGDNTLADLITVTIPNSPCSGFILLEYIIKSNADRTAESGQIRVDINRREGSDTVFALATTLTGVEQQSGIHAETLGVTFTVDAVSGASSAVQTFNIEVTVDSSVSGNPTIQFYGRLLSGDNVGSDASSEITWAVV